MKSTASSLVENLNGRLHCYFFLRRELGQGYLDLSRFFLNHRTFAGKPSSHSYGGVGFPMPVLPKIGYF